MFVIYYLFYIESRFDVELFVVHLLRRTTSLKMPLFVGLILVPLLPDFRGALFLSWIRDFCAPPRITRPNDDSGLRAQLAPV